MLPRSFRIALVTELALVAVQGVCPYVAPLLPLGGSALAQLAFVLTGAIVFNEVKECLAAKKDEETK